MNDTLAHVARGIYQRRRGRPIDDKEWTEALAQHDAFHAEFAVDEACGHAICDALLDARAAIRALAEREPTPGMEYAGAVALPEYGGIDNEDRAGRVWRAMAAQLVKECESDG